MAKKFKITDVEIMNMLRDGYAVTVRRGGIEVSFSLENFGTTARQLGSLACRDDWEVVKCTMN